MHGGTRKWWAWMLAAALAGATGSVFAQEKQTPEQGYPTTEQAAPAAVDNVELVADSKPAPDLAARVAELEKALKKAADSEAAAKKAAASKPTVVPFGMIQADWNSFSQDAGSRTQFPKGTNPTTQVHDSVGFRRARLGLQGDAFQVVEYKLEADIAGFSDSFLTSTAGATGTLEQVGFKDVYIGIHDLPVIGAARVGHFKEPFGLEELTSDRFNTFMERSLSDEGAIVPARNMGVMAYDYSENKRMTWAFGGFVADEPDAPPLFRENSGGYAFTGRYTFLPWYDEGSNGRGLVHTGVAYSYRQPANGAFTYSARPEAFFGPRVVTTGTAFTGVNANVSDINLLGLESAMVFGPLSFQAEYFQSFVDRTTTPDVQFNGAYAFVSYFLTGEHRPYNRLTGTFDRVRPYENFFRVRDGNGDVQTGKGAWEIAYRWSFLDLNDGPVTGGFVRDHTLALNWYLNPYTHLSWNYVNSHVDRTLNGATEGTMDIFEMRFHIDF